MTDGLVWARDGRDWPNREASRFVEAGGYAWHVQVMGQGPAVLLVHGTGASTHSWRHVMRALADRFTVVAADLPGHAFSGSVLSARLSLPRMAGGLAALVRSLGVSPVVVAGHSAGAAIAARMVLDDAIAPASLVAFNGALLPIEGPGSAWFAPIARAMVLMPFVPQFFAWRATDRRAVERLIAGTGSVLDAEGIGLYARLFQASGHVAATLGMMAAWDLAPLLRDLPALRTRLVLVAAEGDRAVPPSVSARVQGMVPGAVLHRVAGGHLSHEEAPADAAALIAATAGA